jgi:polysaccharide biosynthesis transport protein
MNPNFQGLPGSHGEPLVPARQLVVSARATAELPVSGLKHDYAGILEYWQMVRRHKIAVVLASLVGAVIGFLLTLPQPRMFQARTSLEIQGLNEEFLGMRNVNPTVTPTSTYYPEFDIQTQVKILQSATLLRRSAARLEEQKHPDTLQPPDRLTAWRKALHIAPPASEQLWKQALGGAKGSLRVRASGANRIVEVSCESTNPEVAANFVNTLAHEFIEENLEARWKSTEYTGEWLTKQLQDLKIKLEKAEDELQGYARATGLVITSEKDNVDDSKLADLQKELADAHSDRVTKQSKYEMAISSPPEALPDVLDDTSLQDSQHALADLRRQYAQLRTLYTDNHSEVKRVQAQIDAIEAGLEKQRSNILTRIRNEYESAKRREDLLSAGYNTQARRVSDEAEKQAHYNLLKREVDSNRLLYDTMLQKLKEASITSALRASNIRIVDPADAPGSPFKPDVSRSIIVGLLSGIILGVAFSVLRERADRTLQDPGDPTFYLKLPELGVIPAKALEGNPGSSLIPAVIRVNGNGNGNGNGVGSSNGSTASTDMEVLDDSLELISWHRKSSLLAESFRTTLTSILFSGQNEMRPRVLVLTSASPKEGKTTVTSNLGIAMAEIQHRVLLIDADLRRPRMHKIFGVDNDRGLSDLLASNQPFSPSAFLETIQPTGIPKLNLITSGSSRHNASTLLFSERLPEVMRMAREQFDSVLIDTPPMVNIADARVLARYADGLILIVRSAVTTRDAALLAKQRFTDDGVNVLGTILNGWNPNTPGYGYYRYYYAGYYHYYGKTVGKEA